MNNHYFKSLIALCGIFHICIQAHGQSFIEKRLRYEDYSKVYHDQKLVDSTKYFYDEDGLIIGRKTYDNNGDFTDSNYEISYIYPSKNERIQVSKYSENYRIEIHLTWSNGDTLAKEEILRYINNKVSSGSTYEYEYIKEGDTETRITTSGEFDIGSPLTRSQSVGVYNSVGDVVMSLSKEWNGNQWVTDLEVEFEYDDQGRLILRSENYQDGRCYKDIYEYDEEGRLILNYGNNEEYSSYKQVYNYNEDGYTILDEYWLDGQLIWELVNVNLESLRFIHKGPDHYYVEELDVHKNIISETWQENIDGKITTQIFYEYDSNQNLLSESTSRVWSDSTRSTDTKKYEYDPNNILIYQEYINSNGILTSYDKWNYDINNNLSSIESYSSDAIVEPSGDHVEYYSILKYKDRGTPTPLNEIAENEGFFIFPNPATDYVNIQIFDEKHINSNFTLYDLNAKSILHAKLNSLKNTINLYNVNSGLYVLAIEKNGEKYSQNIFINP